MNICELLRFEENVFSIDEKSPDLIKERLYMGNMINASDKDTLKKLGITHILIYASYIEPMFPKDFIYKQIQVHDLPHFIIKEHLEDCFT